MLIVSFSDCQVFFNVIFTGLIGIYQGYLSIRNNLVIQISLINVAVSMILGDNGIKQWTEQIKPDQCACGVINIVTNNQHKSISDMDALAYIVGRFIGVEMQSLEVQDLHYASK